MKLQALQQGDVDCLVGAQLLREGLDIPQVSLVAILDAGVPGFMRCRAADADDGPRRALVRGEALLFADEPYTPAMREAVAEVQRRRGAGGTTAVRRRRARRARERERVAVSVRGDGERDRGDGRDRRRLGGRAVVVGDERRPERAEDDSAAESGGVFAPSEEVESADARVAAERAGAVADGGPRRLPPPRRARGGDGAGSGPVWGALAKDFTERLEALFSVTDAKKAEGSIMRLLRGKENEGVPAFAGGAEAVLRARAGRTRTSRVCALRTRPTREDGRVPVAGRGRQVRHVEGEEPAVEDGGRLSRAFCKRPEPWPLLARARAPWTCSRQGERDALALEERLIQRIKPP